MRVPGSRLIDLKRGELRSEDFPLKWTDAAADDVTKRVERFERFDRKSSIESDDLPLPFDAERRLSSRTEAGVDTSTELLRGEKKKPDRSEPEDPAEEPFNPEEAIADPDPRVGVHWH